MVARSLFATRIYEASLSDERGFDVLNDDLLEACRMLQAEDRAGQAWCKARGYGGYTSYASLDDLPARATAFADLKRRLDRHVADFAKDLAFDLRGGKVRLDSLWVNILKPGAAHSGHIHPHSVVSGTVYVATPPGAGALRLEDPRLGLMMAAPTRLTDAAEALQPFVTLAPRPGTLFLWESWLRHEVLANRAKTERISISFNYSWR